MQKIMLALIFCSVTTLADTIEKSSEEEQIILKKTLQEVKQFKKDKNDKIQRLQVELQLLKKNFNFIKHKKDQEIKKLKKRVKVSHDKIVSYQKSQRKVKKELKISQNKIITFQKSQKKLKNKLKDTKEIVKDLHVMLKKKQEIEMDEYALGQYYFNH